MHSQTGMEERDAPSGRGNWRGDRTTKLLIRFAPLALALVLAGIFRERVAESFRVLRDARPTILWVVPLFLLWNHVAAVGWRTVLSVVVPDDRLPSSFRLGVLRIQSQAVNAVLPTAGLGGEVLRAALAVRAEKRLLPGAMTATALDNVAGTVAGLAFAVPSLFFVLARHGDAPFQALFASALAALAAIVVLSNLPFYLAPRVLARVTSKSMLTRLLDPFATRRQSVARAFRRDVAWRLLERVLGAVEVFIAFHALGVDVSPIDAAAVSATFVVVSFVVFVIPGQLGVAELSATFVGTMLGVPPSVGLAVALLRRSRQWLVCAAGLVLLAGSRWGLGTLVHSRNQKAER
jgi:hypothetical protein